MSPFYKALLHFVLAILIIRNLPNLITSISDKQNLLQVTSPFIVIIPSYIILLAGNNDIGIAGIILSIFLLVPTVVPADYTASILIKFITLIPIILSVINLLHKTFKIFSN